MTGCQRLAIPSGIQLQTTPNGNTQHLGINSKPERRNYLRQYALANRLTKEAILNESISELSGYAR